MKRWGKESPEEPAVVSVAAATGGRGQMGAATGTAAREPRLGLSCCSASTQLLPAAKAVYRQPLAPSSLLPGTTAHFNCSLD